MTMMNKCSDCDGTGLVGDGYPCPTCQTGQSPHDPSQITQPLV